MDSHDFGIAGTRTRDLRNDVGGTWPYWLRGTQSQTNQRLSVSAKAQLYLSPALTLAFLTDRESEPSNQIVNCSRLDGI